MQSRKFLAFFIVSAVILFFTACGSSNRTGSSSGSSGSGSSGSGTSGGSGSGTSGGSGSGGSGGTGSGGSASAPRYLYFTVAQHPGVAPIGQNGVPGNPTNFANPDPGSAMGYVAANPAGTFLYISEFGGQTSSNVGHWQVAEFSIDRNSGALTHKTTIPIPNAGVEKVDPTDSLIAFGGNVQTSVENGHPNAAVYKINSDGSLTPGAAPVELFGFTVMDMAFDASGQYLYVLSQQSNPATPGSSLQVLRADKSAASLTLLQSIPLTVDAQSIAVIGSKYVYVGLANEIAGYSIQSNGSLAPITGTPFGSGIGAYGLAATPDGKRLYVSDILKNDIAWFTVDSTGALSIDGSSAPGSFRPETATNMLIDRSGRFIYGMYCIPVNPGCQPAFWGGTIASDGSVTPMPGAPFSFQPGGYDLVY